MWKVHVQFAFFKWNVFQLKKNFHNHPSTQCCTNMVNVNRQNFIKCPLKVSWYHCRKTCKKAHLFKLQILISHKFNRSLDVKVAYKFLSNTRGKAWNKKITCFKRRRINKRMLWSKQLVNNSQRNFSFTHSSQRSFIYLALFHIKPSFLCCWLILFFLKITLKSHWSVFFTQNSILHSRYVARRLFGHICHLYVFLSFIRFYGSFSINFTGNFVTFRSILWAFIALCYRLAFPRTGPNKSWSM